MNISTRKIDGGFYKVTASQDGIVATAKTLDRKQSFYEAVGIVRLLIEQSVRVKSWH